MSLRHAILGFLAHCPMTGYDLKRHMARSVSHFWPADQAQIYRTLSGLVADGLVAVETEEQTAKPNRQVHSIRPEGLAELDRWLAEPIGITPSREPFLMRLFFVGRLGAGGVRALLAARIAEAEALLSALDEVRAEAQQAAETGLEGRLRLATQENGAAHARAERDWAAALLNEIGEQDG
ncbi:PadR family transcriptional regulator [Sinisalibacter aestuarii]|nr:PadR family transcriptional regulator [Sinisalibacter aestuarii]